MLQDLSGDGLHWLDGLARVQFDAAVEARFVFLNGDWRGSWLVGEEGKGAGSSRELLCNRRWRGIGNEIVSHVGAGSGGRARLSRSSLCLFGDELGQGGLWLDQALLELYRTRGLGVRILRLGFVYGEGDPHVHESLPLLSQWHPAKRLHMVHHADVSQALLRAVTTAGIDGQIYNVADDAPVSLAELRRLNGLEDAASDVDTSFTNPWELILDTLRIRDELGFRPIYPSYYAARDAGAL